MPEEQEVQSDFESFSLMNFKFKYSNEDTPDVLKWIEEKYGDNEKENFSWWLAEYKHDRTIKGNQVFMTTNLINGWFRDIDAARKDAFCSACVLSDKADDADQFIKMVWLIKGQELPKSLKEQELNIPLSDNCDFKKLDYSNPDDKKIIEDMLLWSDEIMGKKFHEGKLFK